MMSSEELTAAICEIRDLLRLIAEPHIAARDAKLRDALAQIVGGSATKQKAVLAMDGSRTQSEIHKETGMHVGNLSTLVKTLSKSGLLSGDLKRPNLAIPIPSNFFD